MKMSFRWYGDSDPVSLAYIRQIPGIHGIVSAVYDVPVGETWPVDKIKALKANIESHGMAFDPGLQRLDVFDRPGLAHWHVIDGRDDAMDAGDLADIGQ